MMKVQELRKLLSEADRSCLEKAFVESYKQFSKHQKEESDPIIIPILEGKEVEKTKTGNTVSFEELKLQIKEFIENAYAQNYFAPNRVIPKSQRPKWRFKVKSFIKELAKIPPEHENYPEAIRLLADLYALICTACNYYLFSTEDPFRSIGWDQPQFFELLVKKTFAAGYSRENISNMLLYATTGGLSRISLHIQQEMVLLSELKTSDVKIIAIEEAEKLVTERTEKIAGLGKHDNRLYDLEDAVDELCSMILIISIALAEAEKGVRYYFKHTRMPNKEIALYRVLNLIELMEKEDLWIEVYEYGVKKKIKPRECLRLAYEERKKRTVSDTDGV